MPRSGFIPLARAGVRLHLRVAACRGLLIAITKVCVARCLARPLGRNKEHRVWLSPMGRQGIKRKAGLGCCAQRFCGCLFPH